VITTNDGRLCTIIDQIKDVVASHFHQLYIKENDDSEEGNKELLKKIPALVTKEENKALLQPINEEEIIQII